MSEQELVEQAKRIFEQIQGAEDPLALYAEYNAIVDELGIIRRPTGCPLALLPVELLLKIFEVYVADQGNPYVLSKVSSQWRTLVQQAPNLWTHIDIKTTSSTWVENFKARSILSGTRPLHLIIYFPLTAEEINQMAEMENFQRWQSVVIRKGRSTTGPWRFLLKDPRLFLKLLRDSPFPQLKDIDVQMTSNDTRSPFFWSKLFPERQNLDALPDPIKATLLSHLTVNLYYTGTLEVLQVLRDTPELNYLRFIAQRQVGGLSERLDNQVLVPLHNLHYLRIENTGMDILLSIDCPSIEVLQAYILLGHLPALQSKLNTFSNLKFLELTIVGSYIPHLPNTYLPDTYPSIIPTDSGVALTRLTFTFERVKGSNLMIHLLLKFFSSTRNVKLSHDQDDFDWPSAISVFAETVEELTIGRPRAVKKVFYVDPKPSSSQFPYPRLKSLQIEGKACSPILNSIIAPSLQTLFLREAQEFAPDVFLSFIRRSPDIRNLRLEGVHMAISDPLFITLSPPLSTFIEEFHTTHDDLPILRSLSLPSLRTLRFAGVLQGKTVERLNAYFDLREIHLSEACKLDPTLLGNLTTLDLCVANVLFPIVTGFVDLLPLLAGLEFIALPRTLHNTDVTVDILVQNMRQAGIKSGDKSILPRLKRLHTEDYPEWESFLTLLAERNRTAHIKGEKKENEVVALEELNLPGLPHPSILERVQLAMAGKFPPPKDQQITTNTAGCDDCMIAGWVCEDPIVERDSKVRSSCSRHRLGTVRITAYS